MRIVVRHDGNGDWWWTAFRDDGTPAAVSAPHGSRTDCMRALAELRVEGPAAQITYDAADAPRPSAWTSVGLRPVRT